MPALLDVLGRHVDDDVLRAIADRVGAGEDETRRVVSAALPVLVGALARKANDSERGARALGAALDRDHDGTLLDHLGDVVRSVNLEAGTLPGGGAIGRRTVDGRGILDHALGGRRVAVEDGLSRTTDVDPGRVGRLLDVLAPLVMSAMGRLRRERRLDDDKLASLLNRERAEMERSVANGGRPNLLDFLEGDDGEVAEEVAYIGEVLRASDMIERVFGRPQPS